MTYATVSTGFQIANPFLKTLCVSSCLYFPSISQIQTNKSWDELPPDGKLQGLKKGSHVWNHPLQTLPLDLQAKCEPSIGRLRKFNRDLCQSFNCHGPFCNCIPKPDLLCCCTTDEPTKIPLISTVINCQAKPSNFMASHWLILLSADVMGFQGFGKAAVLPISSGSQGRQHCFALHQLHQHHRHTMVGGQ